MRAVVIAMGLGLLGLGCPAGRVAGAGGHDVLDGGVDGGGDDAGVAPVFQPGFFQPLRSSASYDRLTTLRLKFPLGRGGHRVRVTFRAGDGPLRISRATIAPAGALGAVAAAPLLLTFAGQPDFSAPSWEERTSDPVAFEATRGGEVFVTFEVEGAVASSGIVNFPGSFAWSGGGASLSTVPSGAIAEDTARGVAIVEVEAEQTPVFVALGDSITEGYINGTEDYRNAWPSVAQASLGVPVLNGGVSGQDIWGEILNHPAELGPLQGVTDCVVALGTNDLPCDTPEQVEGWMQTLLDDLRPRCRLWLATITPREVTSYGSIDQVRVCRGAINAWILGRAGADGGITGVLDFDAVTRSPANPDLLKPEFQNDGVHPTVAGQAAMGAEAARGLSPP